MPSTLTRLALCTILLCPAAMQAQSGGREVFTFLNNPVSARLGALGGYQVALQDDDINLAAFNPAALNPRMDEQLSFTYSAHLAGIKQGYVAFGKEIGSLKTTFHAGMQFSQYGSMPATDEYGNIYGTFKASDLAFTVGAGRQLSERLSVGANLRLVSSALESYKATGLMADIGALYTIPEKGFTAGLSVRNVGGLLSSYSEEQERTPIDIQVGVSKKLKHLPFRFGVVAHQLQRWNLQYDDPLPDDDVLFIGEDAKEPSKFGQFAGNFFKHFIFNGEFLIGKQENFRLRFSYNHLRHAELKVPDIRGLGGFGLGVGFKVYKFHFDYGVSFYHPAGAMHQFTLATNFARFRKAEKSLLN